MYLIPYNFKTSYVDIKHPTQLQNLQKQNYFKTSYVDIKPKINQYFYKYLKLNNIDKIKVFLFFYQVKMIST